MKNLMRVHRYLSCIVAPAMIFFAVSGAWQTYRLQEDSKNGSYKAPAALRELSAVHKAERLAPQTRSVFRAGQLLVALLFVTTAFLGIVMALRLTRPVWLVWLCLAAGVAIPLLIALVARSG